MAVKKPLGRFDNAAVSPFLRAEGRVSGPGWSGGKSWATQGGLYDPKTKQLTPLGRAFDRGDALSLYLLALHLQHPDAKREVLDFIRARGATLSDDRAGLLIGYALTRFRDALTPWATADLASVVSTLGLFTGLDPASIRSALKTLAGRGYIELWTAAPPHQITRMPESVQPDDWVGLHDLNGMERALEAPQEVEAEEEVERVPFGNPIVRNRPPRPIRSGRTAQGRLTLTLIVKRRVSQREMERRHEEEARRIAASQSRAQKAEEMRLQKREDYRSRTGEFTVREPTLRWPAPPGKKNRVMTGEAGRELDEEKLRFESRAELEAARQKRATNPGRDEAAIRKGVAAGRATLREIAENVAEWMRGRYAALVPGKVMRSDPLRVVVQESGGRFTFRIEGGPEAQKWARIIEGGASGYELTNVARLSRKRKAVQIYRAKTSKSGKKYLRGGAEGQPGYYYTVPLVWGKGVKREDGRIDLTEIFTRKTYNARGEGRDASLRGRDASILAGRVGEYDERYDTARHNELDDDPMGRYDGKRNWERTQTPSHRAARYDLDEGGDPVIRPEEERRPGLLVTRDPKNDRLLLTRGVGVPDQPYRQTRNADGSLSKVVTEWKVTGDGRFVKSKRTISEDDPRAQLFESNASADLDRKTGGRITFRPPREDGGGNIVRFRRVSTRGKAPLRPIPPREGHWVLRDAGKEFAKGVAQAKRELHDRRGPRGLTIAQQAELRTLEAAL